MAVTMLASGIPAPKTEVQDEETGSEPTPATDSTPVDSEKQSQSLLEKDPFSNETSRILFNGMDLLRQCGQLLDLPLPQLVIVGAQSTGKSSLLQSLTDIPFRVGSKLTTRFATRVVSRRSPKDVVNIKISRPASDGSDSFNIIHSWSQPSMSAESFDKTFREAADKMGINLESKQGGPHFSNDVLEIELSGPNRSYFGILDIPGLFHLSTGGVTDEEKKQVEEMIVSYMKQRNNYVICVAPASDDIAHQTIVKLAYENAKSGVVGVFTKCDRASTSYAKETVRMTLENIAEYPLSDGWFVVRNADEDHPPETREALEAALFKRDPWNQIVDARRGTDVLKRFLAHQLASRMRENFPVCLRKIKHDLAIEEAKLGALGSERLEFKQQKDYLDRIAQEYKDLADKALSNPVSLPSDGMKLRGKVQDSMADFGEDMKTKGAKHKFIDMNEVQYDQIDKTPLYKEIGDQIAVNRGEELAGMTNPAVLQALFAVQTSDWETYAQEYLDEVADQSAEVSNEIFSHIVRRYAIPPTVQKQLLEKMQEFKNQARSEFQKKLSAFCDEHSKSPLATTDEGFERKVKEAQRARFVAALRRFRSKYEPEGIIRAHLGVLKEPSSAALTTASAEWVIFESSRYDEFFNDIHPRMARNTKDEIHDLLKAYYEIDIEYFKTYIHDQIVEKFLRSERGPLFGLSTFLKGLNTKQVEELGSEDPSVAASRKKSKRKIEVLERALKYAEDTLEGMKIAAVD